jgi:methionine sulfoxide reductase catalytic subunit
MLKIQSSEITPEDVYLNRRAFMKTAVALTVGAGLAACGAPTEQQSAETEEPVPLLETNQTTDELGDPLNTYEQITNYNNYYEFTTDKAGVARLSRDFVSSPWQVEVVGLVNNPKIFDFEELLKFEQEERVYRLRCVEAWSMVIPWIGFPLRKLLDVVEPTSDVQYVRFVTLYDPGRFPGQEEDWFPWPYVEGLRIDEAMHDLTILATGLYGRSLLPQNGAPVRLVVPWKYGFKSIKSIVSIQLVDQMPKSLWMKSAPEEYGFYANVNPEVNHPRWSQASERRIGELGRRETLMFNGYVDEVASLYEGMDLRVNY